MENRQFSKKIEVEEKTYQITKMDPRTACWLFAFLGTRTQGSILQSLGRCSRSEFDEIQSLSLKHVFTLDGEFPIAVVAPSGEFTNKDFNTRPDLLFRLVTESILFSLSPFLQEKESKLQMSAQGDSNLPPTSA